LAKNSRYRENVIACMNCRNIINEMYCLKSTQCNRPVTKGGKPP